MKKNCKYLALLIGIYLAAYATPHQNAPGKPKPPSPQISITLEGSLRFSSEQVWSPDSSKIVLKSLDGKSLYIYSATTGEALLSLEVSGHTNGFDQVAWSPDGTKIATESAGIVTIWHVMP